MKKQLIFSMILSTILCTSCEKEIDLNVDVVNYGTSFGMCVGPCRKELNFVNNEVSFTVFTTEGRGAMGGVPKTFKESLGKDFQKSLTKNLDYKAFKQLNETIGCPDCADGGAEWVEIISGDTKHRVTFEYGKSPKEIDALVTILREKKAYFEQKYLK